MRNTSASQVILPVLLICLIVLGTTDALGQASTSYRLPFKYRITDRKMARLVALGHGIRDSGNNPLSLCNRSTLKTLVQNDNGILRLDPWSIVPQVDSCSSSRTSINSTTAAAGLTLANLTRTTLGDPTYSITLHYQTIIVGFNTIQVKIRPSVQDFKDSTYTRSVTAGSFNLGVSVGYSFGWTKFTHRSTNSYSVTPGLSFGFGAASLASGPLKKGVTVAYNPSNFVFSPALSVTLARNDIGIVIALGKDQMYGPNADAWAYQGKYFFGFGLSAGLKL